MTEAEWLTTTNAHAMLQFLDTTLGPQQKPGQDVNTRYGLMYCAMSRVFKRSISSFGTDQYEANVLETSERKSTVLLPTPATLGDILSPDHQNNQGACRIIRDIFLWPEARHLPKACWKTPEVESLAQAALDNRKVQCPVCRGRGVVRDNVPYGELGPCETCKGAKEATGPTFDSTRLAILADAMEEAGCGNSSGPETRSWEDEVLRHLRGFEKCRDCHHVFPDSAFGGGGGVYWCPCCGGSEEVGDSAGWVKAKTNDHYLGCWALEFVVGRGL